MAAGVLPKIGTKYGPCEGECQHKDCALNRKMAEAPCKICGEPIGYDTRFYNVGDSNGLDLTHALCEEERIEAKQAKEAAAS